MAHTKQTPRNPNLERPSAAMGSDVQERRIPSKPTSKKIATKGGKQPHANICSTDYLKGLQLLVELRNHIDIIQDC